MGSSAKGQAEQQQRLQGGYNTGAAAYAQNPGAFGGDVNAIPWENSDLGAAQRTGWLDAQNQAQQQQFEMPMFEMPDFSEQANSMQQSFNASVSNMQAQIAEREAENRRIQEENAARAAEAARLQKVSEMNDLYGLRVDAANQASDYINAKIATEQSNANLMGIDYNITDEMKQERINNYFASVWGEGDESQLDSMMSEYGTPEGHTEYTITRGDASAYQGNEGGDASTNTVSRSRGMRPTITEEDTLGGGTAAILGGA